MREFTDIFLLNSEELTVMGIDAINLLPLVFAIRAKDLVSVAKPDELKAIAEALTVAFGPGGIAGYAIALKKTQEGKK